jgi:hypothetical protein
MDKHTEHFNFCDAVDIIALLDRTEPNISLALALAKRIRKNNGGKQLDEACEKAKTSKNKV